MPDLSPQELASQSATSREFMPLTMSVLRQTVTKTPIDTKSGDFVAFLTNVPCDIIAETINAVEGTQGSRLGTLTTWTIYTGIEWDINANDRVLDNLGRTFEVNNVVEVVGSDEYTTEQILGCSRIS